MQAKYCFKSWIGYLLIKHPRSAVYRGLLTVHRLTVNLSIMYAQCSAAVVRQTKATLTELRTSMKTCQNYPALTPLLTPVLLGGS